MTPSCVLFSGGLDSAVLLALELRRHAPVYPIHVRYGLAWEEAERRAIDRLLETAAFAASKPLSTVHIDMRDVYPPTHWAVVGRPPAYDTPDEDVYLVGRNVILLSKTAVLCARLGVGRIALGTLSNNPFPDASPQFFEAMSRALTLGLAHPIATATPLSEYHKEDVVRLGSELGVAFELTMSCMSPASEPLHCGACSKCRERRDAFRIAGINDPTEYAMDWNAAGRQ